MSAGQRGFIVSPVSSGSVVRSSPRGTYPENLQITLYCFSLSHYQPLLVRIPHTMRFHWTAAQLHPQNGFFFFRSNLLLFATSFHFVTYMKWLKVEKYIQKLCYMKHVVSFSLNRLCVGRKITSQGCTIGEKYFLFSFFFFTWRKWAVITCC